MSEKCSSCGVNHCRQCDCGFCNREMVCESCAKEIHQKLARFFSTLLKARPTQRSNSARSKLLELFYEIGGRQLSRHKDGGRDRKFFFNSIRDLNSFSDSRTFEIGVRKAIQVFPFTPDAVKDLVESTDALIFEELVNRTAAVLRHDHDRKIQEKKSARILTDFYDAIDAQERLRAI